MNKPVFLFWFYMQYNNNNKKQDNYDRYGSLNVKIFGINDQFATKKSTILLYWP
jgi:hypothetical protein